ncbi:SDR family NAD(P)-dependent oxidoreductase [Novosphingobium sp. ERN07]|nr:SDR family NAD(P)-dependent oxidoreductase [Novosphingobium sp. ERN07]
MGHVLILGASGELGTALALECAKSASLLTLWGRDRKRLALTAELCRKAGGTRVNAHSVDLLDLDAALAALRDEDDRTPIDTVIFASGLGDIRAATDTFDHPELVSRLYHVNCVAPSALGAELAQRMAARPQQSWNGDRKGHHIVFIGSAAGFAPMPFAASYAASKAGLARFADSLRIAMRPHGISVTLVSPGFIDTAAAHRVPGPKPFMISPQRGAGAILAAMRAQKAHLIFPWPFALIRLVLPALPRPIRDRLLRSLAPPVRSNRR